MEQTIYSPSEKRRKVIKFCYYVTKLGFTAKEAAAEVGISEKLAGKWVKEHKLKGAMAKLQNEIRVKPMKFDESLTAFNAYIRIHYPLLYASIDTAYKNFLNTL